MIDFSSWDVNASDFSADGSDAEKLEFLVHYAVLAPSSHNSQPWLSNLHENHIDLIADRSRALPVVDPFDRELIISCGAALALLQTAALGLGCRSTVHQFPAAGQPDLLASFYLDQRQEPSTQDRDLLRAILIRRTSRLAFGPKPIPVAQQQAIVDVAAKAGGRVCWIEEPKDRKRFAELVMAADRAQFENTPFRRELASWIRPTRTSSGDGMPAPAIGIEPPASYLAPLVIRTFDLGNGQAARDEELVRGSPGILVLTTPPNEAYDWLTCGEALGFILLTAEASGLNASYLNQACEDDDARLYLSLMNGFTGTPQIALRLGYGTAVPPTPRRSIAEVLRKKFKPSRKAEHPPKGKPRGQQSSMIRRVS